MLPELTIPPSLAGLLAALRPCFATAPTFTTFCALVCGMLAQAGRRTVTGYGRDGADRGQRAVGQQRLGRGIL